MSQRPQPVSKNSASKHRRPTAAGRHRRITEQMQRRAEANRRRAMLAKCVASVGAVAALTGGVSTGATSTLASAGTSGGPESAAAKQDLNPVRTPSRNTSAGTATRSLARAPLTGISGGAVSGAGTATPDLVDPAASPAGDGPLPAAVGTVQVETATLVTTQPARPKSKSATSVPKVTKVTPAAKVTKVAATTVATTTPATTTKTVTTGGSTTKKGSGGSTTSGSGGTTTPQAARRVLALARRLGLGLGWRDGASGDAAGCVVGQSAGSR